MAQEGSEASVTSTSSNPNWWDIHANTLSSWMAPWQQQQQQQQQQQHHHHHQQQQQPNSTSCNEDMPTTSFANLTRNHSGLSGTDDSSEPVDHHLWSHLLLGVGGNAAGGGGNPSEAAMFEAPPASCDYQNWSIAPPQRELEALRIEAPPDSSSASSYVASSGFLAPCYEDVQQQQQQGGSPPQVMGGVGYHVGGLKEPFHGLGGCRYGGVVGVQDAAWSIATRNFTDLISFGSSVNKAMVVSGRPCSRGLDVAEVRKQLGNDTTPSPSTRRNVKGTGNASEGKNKRSEDGTPDNSLTKKPKHETSKLPKVKLADKITALQQIVSPFGKTDTASVLLEAINYIRFLHEQVQLLSDPYMKSGVNKDHTSWGGLERKDVTERKVDLSSRGLCLVPISCTPQVYRENTGPDYLTPTYRGCLYR